jgi:transcriptional regulator with XRE-family HTH domain
MAGVNLKALAAENPAIAVAVEQVKFIHEAAKLLRDFREAAQLSTMQVAESIGVTTTRIQEIESGKPGCAPSLAEIAGIANCCGVEVKISLQPTL